MTLPTESFDTRLDSTLQTVLLYAHNTGVTREEAKQAIKELILSERVSELVVRKEEQTKTVMEIAELFPTASHARRTIATWWSETFQREATTFEAERAHINGGKV